MSWQQAVNRARAPTSIHTNDEPFDSSEGFCCSSFIFFFLATSLYTLHAFCLSKIAYRRHGTAPSRRVLLALLIRSLYWLLPISGGYSWWRVLFVQMCRELKHDRFVRCQNGRSCSSCDVRLGTALTGAPRVGTDAKHRKGRMRRMSGVWGLNREILIILVEM